MISLMSKQSLKSSRMRNIFVMITIVLAAALLMAISMYAVGQQEDNQRRLSHAQEVGYYNLTNEQVETLKDDERIAYQIQVKMGTTSEMDGFEVIPYYVSELSDKIQIGELESGKLPVQENEIAVQGAMLKKMGIDASIGSQITLNFYDGNTETFTVTGLLKGGENAKQFAAFFSQSYAESGSQLKDESYEVYAKLYGATTMRSEDCKEAMYLIGSDAGIERKYVSPSKAFLDSLSVDTQDVLKIWFDRYRDPACLYFGYLRCILPIRHRQNSSIWSASHYRYDEKADEKTGIKRRTQIVSVCFPYRYFELAELQDTLLFHQDLVSSIP